MKVNTIYEGNALDILKTFPDEYIEYECPHCNLRLREETKATKIKWFRN